MSLVREVAPPDPDPRVHFRIHHASFPLAGGRLHVERASATATLRTSSPVPDDDVVHPGLSRAAAVFGHWMGREVFHGGAFAADGGAWAVLGGKMDGKSTLLAALALQGHEVLTDDVLVTSGKLVYAGPRCIDLRPGTASAIGVHGVNPSRGATRQRLLLAPATAGAVRLAGVVHLRFGPKLFMARVAPRQRIERLRQHSWLGPFDPIEKHNLLDLAALPTFELVRPRRIEAVRDSAQLVLTTVSD